MDDRYQERIRIRQKDCRMQAEQENDSIMLSVYTDSKEQWLNTEAAEQMDQMLRKSSAQSQVQLSLEPGLSGPGSLCIRASYVLPRQDCSCVRLMELLWELKCLVYHISCLSGLAEIREGERRQAYGN